MKFLIFEPCSSGHHLEYIRHQLTFASTSNDFFVFVLALGLAQGLVEFQPLIKRDNIKIIYLSDIDSNIINNSSVIQRGIKLCTILRKYQKLVNAEKIILNEIISFMPFLPLYINGFDIIRGIVYKIPRYRGKRGTLTQLKDNLIYKIFSLSKVIEYVWLLNANTAIDYYNKRFHTLKFKFLPDPINVTGSLNENILSKYKKTPKIILVHGGGMGARKGTFEIIDAVKSLPFEYYDKFVLILAGKISNIKENERLKNFIEEYSSKIEIEYSDRFIPFEDLYSYISIADYVLIPYKNVEQSSGILGYAAYFNKEVIGPSAGLLGELIKKYNLGICLKSITAEALRQVFITLSKSNCENKLESEYVKINKVEEFVNSIFIK